MAQHKQSSNRSFNLRKLIIKARQGDQSAFEELLRAYSPLIHSLANSFFSAPPYSPYREDMIQEATVAFYNAVVAYDLEQADVEFGLFAKICISHALTSQLRIIKRVLEEPVSEFPLSISGTTSHDDPVAHVLSNERLMSLHAMIRNNLSSFEYSVWQLYMEGRTASAIAKLLDADLRSVNNAIYRVRKKLRSLIDRTSPGQEQ